MTLDSLFYDAMRTGVTPAEEILEWLTTYLDRELDGHVRDQIVRAFLDHLAGEDTAYPALEPDMEDR